MPSNTWSDRLARGFALLRGAMIITFSVALIAAPEKMMVGSSSEPAWSLVVIFASRSILLGLVLVVLALARQRKGLAWVLLADAALQLFDTAMALATGKEALAIFPAALGILDVWSGLFLLRAGKR